MVVRTIRILTDKSSTAHHHADALAKGVRDSGSLFNVAVGDLARTPSGKTPPHLHFFFILFSL